MEPLTLKITFTHIVYKGIQGPTTVGQLQPPIITAPASEQAEIDLPGDHQRTFGRQRSPQTGIDACQRIHGIDHGIEGTALTVGEIRPQGDMLCHTEGDLLLRGYEGRGANEQKSY